MAHGKPHPEQGQIGTSRETGAGGPFVKVPGWLLEAVGNGGPR